jgi:hypothetical protein
VIFDLSSTPPVYEFLARTSQIVLMKDVGQEKATFDGATLRIPSITYGTAVLRNLVFELIDPAVLEFKLVSYENK